MSAQHADQEAQIFGHSQPSYPQIRVPETPWTGCRNVLIAAAWQSHFILQKHIEDGHCREFDPTKPIGTHVPRTWNWLCDLAIPDPPLLTKILDSAEAKNVMRSSCVLCGQKLGSTGHLIAHLQADHRPLLEEAELQLPDLVPVLKHYQHCSCACQRPKAAHRCPVHVQTLLLHYVCKHSLQPKRVSSAKLQADFEAMWKDDATRAKLTSQCSQCDFVGTIHELGPHLQTHTELLSKVTAVLPLAQSPFVTCCDSCFGCTSCLSVGPQHLWRLPPTWSTTISTRKTTWTRSRTV